MVTPADKNKLWHHTKQAGHWLGWRILHLFFPTVVHYLTDKYQNKHHHLVVDTFYATIAIVLITINVALGIWWGRIFTPVDVSVGVELPETIQANGPFNFEVLLQNGEEEVEQMTILVELPAGLEPLNTENVDHIIGPDDHILEIPVGHLAKHELRTITIPAWFVGDVGRQQKIRTFVTYTHFQHEWEVTHGVSFTADSSALTFSTQLPEQVLNSQSFDWQISFHNTADQPITDLTFDLTIPEDLSIQTVEGGEYSSTDQTVTLSEVAAGAEGVIKFTSAFHETFDSNKQISVTAFIPGHTGRLFSQGSQDVGADALRPSISLTVTTNRTAVYLGETIYYTINLKNVGDAALSDFVVTAHLDGEAFNLAGAYGKDAVHANSTLTWTLAETIAPGETKQLTFSVPTRASLTDHNLSVRVEVSAQAIISDIEVKTISQIVISEVKFNSNMTLTTSVVYTGPSGEQFGYGPWPVEANQITAVRVFWSIKNVNNQVNQTVVSTTLPGQVEWTGSSSVSYGSGLVYDEATRTVSWTVGSLPADGRTLGVSFEARVLPNVLQVGKYIRLTNETVLSGIDSFTGVILSRTANPVLTPDSVTAETGE
ncbi:MAG: CARDB domain-containing protein [Patescibacteria group bacterium]